MQTQPITQTQTASKNVSDLLQDTQVPRTASSNKKIHPLDFATAEELNKAVDLIRQLFASKNRNLRFCRVELKEPPKSVVLAYDKDPNTPFDREVLAVLLDRVEERVYEVTVKVNPGSEQVVSCVHVPGVQPCFLTDEYEVCEEVVKSDPKVIQALKKRGITDMSSVMVDTWCHWLGDPAKRICNPLMFIRSDETANGYDRPIDGIDVFVDLNTMEVIEVKDLFDVPIPPEDKMAQWQGIKNVRTDLKPIHIIQPEGVSFKVEGQTVTWQNWTFRIGFNQVEGLTLHQIGYNDHGRHRQIIYRASIAEMIVPYGDPRSPNHRKNAFDAGEDGLGRNCHSLQLGCDCVGSIYYFDTELVDVGGAPYTVPNAICLHEEDFGTLWKHKDWRTGIVETRRSRRLVVSFFTTIANYDYGFYWYFFQDGHITFEAKLTGILNTSAIKTGDHPGGYGTMVGPNLYAPIHQHFFISRLDMQVDGNENVFQEVNVYRPEPHEPNPYKSAFYVKPTTFKTELEAQRVINPFTARAWKVVNLKSKNRVGTTSGWKIVPLNSAPAFALDDSKIIQRAGFLKKNILVTPYHPDEKLPAGNYVYAKEVDDGLTKWTKANRNIYNTDIVVWYIFGTTHVTRSEDWPVMPAEYAGFTLKPDNFFDISPAMDVPATPSKVECCTEPRAKL